MKWPLILGLLLLGAGAWVTFGNGEYKTKKDLVEVGSVKASVTESQTIPPWVGYASLGAGAALLIAAAVRRRS